MIQKLIILCLTIWVAILLIQRYTWTHDHEEGPHFKVKTCFRLPNHMDNHVDGIVMYIRDEYYIILWSKEAERRYAGPKVGNEIPIKWLDEYASQVTCPKGWVK